MTNKYARYAEDELVCIRCDKKKPVTAFGRRKPYADGTPRYDSSCIACRRAARQPGRVAQVRQEILRVRAPLAAATRLLATNPQALADLVRRYHFDYVPLLEEERQRLLEDYDRRHHKMRKVKTTAST